MICLDKTKTNRCDQKKDEDNTFFLLAFSWRPCCSAKETAEKNSKFQETSFTLFLLFISVLLYYKSHFRQTCHLYSRSPLCVARTRIMLAVFCYLIISHSGEMSKRHLFEGSNRSNKIFHNLS